LNGTAYVGGPANYGRLYFSGTQTLAGVGEIIFGSSSSNRVEPTSGGALTIGPDMWIHGEEGSVTGDILIQGRITADVAGGRITIDGTGWENDGVVEAINDGIIRFGGDYTTAGMGDFRGSDGTVQITGNLDNTGDSLVLNATTGSPIFVSGTILGGTIPPGSDGAELIYTGSAGHLDGVTMDADMHVGTTAGVYLYINNGLVLNGTAYVGGPSSTGRLYFSGAQTLSGTGEIVFGASTSNSVHGTAGPLTIGPDIWIHGEHGAVHGAGGLINQGAISADLTGNQIVLSGTSWSNEGTVEVHPDASVRCDDPLINSGNVVVHGNGTFDGRDTYTQTAGSTTVEAGGLLTADPTIDIQAGTVSGEGTLEGDLTNGGTVSPGVSPGLLTNSGNYTQSTGGTLSVEIGGTAPALVDRLDVSGDATLNGTLDVDLVLSFTPAIEDTFTFLNYATQSGGFTTLDVPPLPTGLAWDIVYGANVAYLYIAGSELHATIQQIADVPDDQGGWVDISWYASSLDDLGAPTPVTEYEVQRFETSWVAIGTVPATQSSTYSTTLGADDIFTVGQPEPWSYYRILTRTSDPGTFYNSPADSGYSFDNLPPDAPVLSIDDDWDYRTISWTNDSVADFEETCLYRGDSPGYNQDLLLLCTTDTTWDETYTSYFYYFAQSMDVHGNLSVFSNEVSGSFPTGTGELPARAALRQNSPNPFNPRTTIRFDLPDSRHVGLVIYTLDGRRVATLIDVILPAGAHHLVWDGRDALGHDVASGTYFYRLVAGNFAETKRMVLLR
jgi:hypothetical protein